MQFVLKNCEILHSVRGLYDTHSASGAVSPQMGCIKSIRVGLNALDSLARFCKELVEGKKFGLISFPGLIYSDQEPLWLLNVIEDVCYFLGVHIRLST